MHEVGNTRFLRWTIAIAALAVPLAAPSASQAAITCSYDVGTQVVAVNLSATGDFLLLDRSGGGVIQVRDGNSPGQTAVACTGGTPDVTNTSEVDVDQPGAGQNAQVEVILFSGGPFEPGTGGPDEGGGTPEIEFDVDLGNASDFDSFAFHGLPSPQVDNIRIGDLASGVTGINVNAPEVGGPDGDDMKVRGSDLTIVDGFGGGGAPNFIEARVCGPVHIPQSRSLRR